MISEFISNFSQYLPEAALFISLALGYQIGGINFGKFKLGSVAGSLLVAVAISFLKVHFDPGIKTYAFLLFLFAVGYESGPRFFTSLNIKSVKDVALALFVAVVSFALLFVLAKVFHLDRGITAGIASGALTQSAIIGTASDAITKLQLPQAEAAHLQANIATGYALTYVLGSILPIAICTNFLEKIYKRDLEAAAKDEELNLSIKQASPLPSYLTNKLATRTIRATGALPEGTTVKEFEQEYDFQVTIEKIIRDDELLIDPYENIVIQKGDIILLVGEFNSIVNSGAKLGSEITTTDPRLQSNLIRKKIIFNNKKIPPIAVSNLYKAHLEGKYRGIYVLSILRKNKSVVANEDFILKHGDVVEIYGTDSETSEIAQILGSTHEASTKTDLTFLGCGMLVGSIIGLFSLKIHGVNLILGSGVGTLISGLIFGYFHSKHVKRGNFPTGALHFLQDFGLATFVVMVGLSSGPEMIQAISHYGIMLFFIGIVVTIVPLIAAALFGRYVLKYNNVAVFAGALAGARSANPAFGQVLSRANNTVPSHSFVITYTLANIFLTLIGPAIIFNL